VPSLNFFNAQSGHYATVGIDGIIGPEGPLFPYLDFPWGKTTNW